ncbi:regulatory signaling modulator protein AmpE [Escherichia coli]
METPKAAVSMAKKTSFVVVVVIALLTIYGALRPALTLYG